MTRIEKNKIIWDNIQKIREALTAIWMAYVTKEDDDTP